MTRSVCSALLTIDNAHAHFHHSRNQTWRNRCPAGEEPRHGRSSHATFTTGLCDLIIRVSLRYYYCTYTSPCWPGNKNHAV
ncbi:hypothetical protein Micbo1qcDRAFT_41057 [Microdochium bolleyi]|uniref:Uncharacterized protein n=1 Tax=Microdochium bolleyi TaxID=196109 RepID=A0A136JAB1_9PEZI|nr:hypothetical protein Micbo1qcDRAFT_41057 [Microdochium bolleyi]